MLVDPGAELLSRIKYPNELVKVNALFISHAHIDHYAGANVALDFMKLTEKQKKIKILAGKAVFDDKNISDYYLSSKGNINVEKIELKENENYDLDGYSLGTVILNHSIESTFGFVLKGNGTTIGYISDTGYTKKFKTTAGVTSESGLNEYEGEFEEIVEKFDHIKNEFKKVDILIANINDLYFNKHSKYHMTGFDLIDILKGSKVRYCFIPNLFPVDLKNVNHAKKVADYISEKSGVKTIAIPKEGLRFSL